MIKYFLAAFALQLSLYGYTQKSYIDYHKQINLAERRCFVEQDIKGGLALYQNVFSSFDFVYAGDCMIAMQLAIFGNSKENFQSFVKKAFENGMSWKVFKRIPYIRKSVFYSQDSIRLKSLYTTARQKYLAGIDTESLKAMYLIFADDQLNKNSLKDRNESFAAFQERYRPVFDNIIARIGSIVRKRGLPMDRLIGLPQQDIMKELKLDCPDLLDIYDRNKNSSKTVLVRSQFVLDEWGLTPGFWLTVIIHQQNIFDQFDSSQLRAQISLGNIHPKDVALLLYNFYRDRKTPVGFKRPHFMVGFNQERLKPNSGPVPDSVVNSYRLPLYLPPIEQDRAKWKFMQDQGMNFIWGYAGFRT